MKCARFDGKCTKALWIDYAVFHFLLSQNMLFHGIRFQVLNVMAPYSSARKFTTSDYRRNICVEFFCTRNTRSRQTYWVCRVEEYAHNKRPQQRVWRRRTSMSRIGKMLMKTIDVWHQCVESKFFIKMKSGTIHRISNLKTKQWRKKRLVWYWHNRN